MRPTQIRPTDRSRARLKARWSLPALALLLGVAGCGSDDDGAANAGAGGETTAAPADETEDSPDATSEAPSADAELAAAALIAPEDLDGDWRVVFPELFWPNTAELARTAPACVSFADLVFEHGALHGTGATTTLQRNESVLYAYVVVFPTVAEAAEMVAAVASPEFDDCWAEFTGVAAMATPFGITEASYVIADPPEMTFDAESYVNRATVGTVVIDGSEVGDSCICVFAQEGRAVVEIHSAAEHLEPAERVFVTQAAIDKLRDVIG